MLRHKPESIGLNVVDNNDKKRFSFNDDLTLIKANQGHSVNVALAFQEITPPDILYSNRFKGGKKTWTNSHPQH